MNRLDETVSGLESLVRSAVSVPVYSVRRQSPDRQYKAPFIRIERPVIGNTSRDKAGEEFDILFTINVFTDERGLSENRRLSEAVRAAVEGNKLDLDASLSHMLRPRHNGSQPLSQPQDDSSRPVKQRALEVRVRLFECKNQI